MNACMHVFITTPHLFQGPDNSTMILVAVAALLEKLQYQLQTLLSSRNITYATNIIY